MVQTASNTTAIQTDSEHRMQKSLDAMRQEFHGLHTGRASVALVENIKVEAYNAATPLKGLASISTPDQKTIVIQPWDASMLGAIEKAISAAGLGLTPNNDGRVVRIKMPQLTQERRDELEKLIRKIAEEGRVSIRNVRHEANDAIKKLEKAGTLGEDLSHSAQKKIQELTDKFIKFIDESLLKKEQEIRQV